MILFIVARGGCRAVGLVRNIVNDTLLNMSYSEKRNIKSFLRNWSGLEALSLKGDRVATCILIDLQRVTGIDIDKWDKDNKLAFIECYKDGCLSELQYISIAFVLVLGYKQEDVAYVFQISQQMIAKSINTGIRKIQRELGEYGGE